METVNEQLLDHAIHHAVDLTRYSNGVVRRMIALLNRADSDLVPQIAAALERVPAGSFTVSHLEQVLGSVRSTNAAAYQQVFGALPNELHDLTGYEVGYQTSLLTHVLPKVVQITFPLAQVSPDQVYAAAMSRPFQGGLLRDWAASVEQGRMTTIRNAIRGGFVEGQTTDQIVRRIKGAKATNYSDGVLEIGRRDLTSVVRTALSHTAATARSQIYEANGDIIAKVQWVSVLDSRTTPMCQIRDGRLYSVDARHKPIGHSVPWLQGPGRLHFCCRSSDVPVTKSWKDLGIDLPEAGEWTRASMDGQVPAATTYGDWIQRQSAGRQDEVLGPTRAALMRKGDLPFDKLFTNRGDMLTLDQLKSRDASVFKRAGL